MGGADFKATLTVESSISFPKRFIVYAFDHVTESNGAFSDTSFISPPNHAGDTRALLHTKDTLMARSLRNYP